MNPKSVTRVLARQPFTPTEKGLYYIQEDTSTNVGTSIMVTESDYPKLKKLEHLADAMIYISTLEEIAKVKNTDDLKKSLDEFWLKLGGTEVNAQRLVKMYYQRVAHVNRYFSSFKEGWKTDRGMIYIVFGRPSEVIQDGQTEQWVYHDLASGQGRFAFEFDRKPSLFSHNHYVLRRGQPLALPWYAQVQQWRKGTVL
jgi:GWxTD domain-containing protein